MHSSMSTLPYILVLYGIGVGLHYLFRGNFRTGLVTLSALLGLLYVMLFVALSSPFKGQDEFGFSGFGLAVLLLFASMIGLPALGVLSSALGSNLASKIKNNIKSVGVVTGVVLALPTFVVFKTITKHNAASKIRADYIRSKSAQYDKKMTYPIKLGDEYLNLPCRPELLHKFNAPVCKTEQPTKFSDYIAVGRFTIPSHKKLLEDQKTCSEREEANSPFCNIVFLPYRISIVTGENEIDLLKKYERNIQEKYNHLTTGHLRGLTVLERKEFTNKTNQPSRFRYKFIRENDDTKAYLTCHTQLPISRQIYGCDVSINFSNKFWVTVNLQAKLNEIGTELDKKTSEVAAYYKYLMNNYRVNSETLVTE